MKIQACEGKFRGAKSVEKNARSVESRSHSTCNFLWFVRTFYSSAATNKY